MSQLIDNELDQRVKTVGFSYSEIIRNLSNVFCNGGSCVEYIQSHLGRHLKPRQETNQIVFLPEIEFLAQAVASNINTAGVLMC